MPCLSLETIIFCPLFASLFSSPGHIVAAPYIIVRSSITEEAADSDGEAKKAARRERLFPENLGWHRAREGRKDWNPTKQNK